MPLQITYPQHQLGESRCAFVQLDAQQLLGRDGFAFQAQGALGFAKGFQLLDDFAFKALLMLQRDVQKVAAAAGWVKHAQGAELVVKAL